LAMSADGFGCELLARRGRMHSVELLRRWRPRGGGHPTPRPTCGPCWPISGLLGLARLYQENLGLAPPT
jgi:hypothetical protein